MESWEFEADSLWVLAFPDGTVGDDDQRVVSPPAPIATTEVEIGAYGFFLFTDQDLARDYIAKMNVSEYVPARFKNLTSVLQFLTDIRKKNVLWVIVDQRPGMRAARVVRLDVFAGTVREAVMANDEIPDYDEDEGEGGQRVDE